MSRALPLDFSLRNSNDESVLFLGGPQSLVLGIQNTSPTPLFLRSLNEAHHFSLRFRAGILRHPLGIAVNEAHRKHWEIDVREERGDAAVDKAQPESGEVDARKTRGDIVVGLRRKTAMIWAPDHFLHLRLEGLQGEIAGGTRATRVELGFDHIRNKEEDGAPVTGKPRHHQMVLTMSSSPGTQVQPLLGAHFVGDTGNVVLNDGKFHAYAIVLRLANTTAAPLGIGHATRFHLILADGPEEASGTLATHEALRKYGLTATLVQDSSVESTIPFECRLVDDQRAVWEIRTPENIDNDLWLAPAGYLEISIADIVTRHRNGPSNVRVRWTNLVQSGDGEVTATLQKSPIVMVGSKIGIGTAEPKAALDVQGDVNIQGRIKAPGKLEIDALLQVNEGLMLGGIKLVAPTLHAVQTKKTEPRHYTAEQFEAFDDWPTSLAGVNPAVFQFPFPSRTMSLLAARGSVRLNVFAEGVQPHGSRFGSSFASIPIPGVVTADGGILTLTADLGSAVTITGIPVQGAPRNMDICTALCKFSDLEQMRSLLADYSVSAGDWAHSFGRNGPNVSWIIEINCSVTALFAD